MLRVLALMLPASSVAFGSMQHATGSAPDGGAYEELAANRAIFDKMDADKNGEITSAELIAASENHDEHGHGPDQHEAVAHAESYLTIYDTDGNGKVTFDEYVHTLTSVGNASATLDDRVEQLVEARLQFVSIDANEDGSITRRELLDDMVSSMNEDDYPEDHHWEAHLAEKEDEADEWMDVYDMNRDGKVTIDEIIHKDALMRKEQAALEAAEAKRESDRMDRH